MIDFTIIIGLVVGIIIRQVYSGHETLKKHLTTYLMYVGVPLLVLHSLVNSKGLDYGIIAGAAATYLVIMSIIFFFIVKPTPLEDKTKASLYICSAFANNGFLGVPFCFLLFGPEGAATASIMALVGVIVHYSIGVVLANSFVHKKTNILKNIINPITIGTIIAFFISFYITSLPKPIELLSKLSTHLLLLLIGLMLVLRKPDKWLFAGIGLKCLLSPLLMLGVLFFSPENNIVFMSLVYLAMAPPAFSNALISARFGYDEEMTAEFISYATLLFVIFTLILTGFM